MFCQRCGNEIKEGSRFCAKCGCSIPIDEKNSNKLSECKEKTSQKKKSGKMILIFFLMLILCVGSVTVCSLIMGNNRIDKSQLIGSWYMDGDDSPYFKLKDGGKAKFAFSLTTDPNGQRHAGLCDVSCKWKIQRGHLILGSITNIDLGEIVSIEDDVLTCDDNGTIVKYRRKGLSIYDVW